MTDTLLRPAPPAALTHEERSALIDSVRRLLADRCTEGDVRRIIDSDSGHDPALWRALVDLGIAGLTVPEAHGGAGLGATELELVMEEAGAVLLPAPLVSAAIAATLVPDLDGLATGERIAAVAFTGRHGWTGRDTVTVAGGRVTGTARFVADAAIADTILVAADEGVFAVEVADARITPLPVFDRTRRMADVAIDAPARQVADAGVIAKARDIGVVALAGEQAGGARRMLEMTVAYARDRHQFGRAIGSFQAIKHMAADLLLESESATSAARDAARQLADGSTTADAAVALAAFACADAFVRVAKDGIQMHGGIAFTWDHPAHLYLRRARSGAQLFGDSDRWRDRYLAALEAQA
ncbi:MULTISPECIES: acyl-CoA dehydrogenase family protein [Sphingomonas]|uniref:Acyl-CoA dehydrogenase n=1 Tax=Sphingomonas adhaesiva TaxID=28212 RepID=A0A2A4I959_9SPHN|nr:MULTISPECIES: acyl-CoA dehydrogenase family protein [Sphingomonas]PCG14330.1 acyl-CoA dehydrogenase [Sphingomonas adhaesiva]PZU75675.1 MAG: acyl-CoA dehydrogenase [Sphingomonas sp.]